MGTGFKKVKTQPKTEIKIQNGSVKLIWHNPSLQNRETTKNKFPKKHFPHYEMYVCETANIPFWLLFIMNGWGDPWRFYIHTTSLVRKVILKYVAPSQHKVYGLSRNSRAGPVGETLAHIISGLRKQEVNLQARNLFCRMHQTSNSYWTEWAPYLGSLSSSIKSLVLTASWGCQQLLVKSIWDVWLSET